MCSLSVTGFPSISTPDGARPTILFYETNSLVLGYLDRTFSSTYRLLLHSEPAALCAQLRAPQKPALIVFAWDNPAHSLELLQQVCSLAPQVPFIVLTFSSEPADFRQFASLGAKAVVLKPFSDDTLELTIAEALPTAEVDTAPREIRLGEGHSFVRGSRRMREIEAQATLVARSDIPVLILGESGTGKEILALFTHKMSRRSSKMFLKVNCAAMPADLLESELFGYEQGAFTGAIKTKPGKFELCDGGTIFLDEIGEMPVGLQAKLLQVLQDGTFSRLGSRAPMRTDVRVIAATNVNMKKAMAEKNFREDLYYRLNGISLLLPPLRERLEELPLLAEYFIRKGSDRYGLVPLPLSPALLHALCRHPWPGNLRELENVINRYLILRDERAVIEDLTPGLGTLDRAPTTSEEPVRTVGDNGLKDMVRGLKGEAESVRIANTLKDKGWNRKAVAKELQISYKALLYKIKQYELTRSA